MIENPTRHKMNEAYHFISIMKNTFEDDDIFSYNLSAFLSAARSITFYMQKKYKHRDGFPAWYCLQQIKMDKELELKYLNKARSEDVHREPVKIGATRERIITGKARIVPAKEPETDVEILEKNELTYTPQKQISPKTVRRFFVDFKDTDVMEFCENQMLKYKILVAECEQKFLNNTGIVRN
ncbi:Uncharacterised protein [uncultured archaeon]|nr:Uncharacterised protein [uncultured archaeon]